MISPPLTFARRGGGGARRRRGRWWRSNRPSSPTACPSPANLETARAVEAEVRDGGRGARDHRGDRRARSMSGSRPSALAGWRRRADVRKLVARRPGGGAGRGLDRRDDGRRDDDRRAARRHRGLRHRRHRRRASRRGDELRHLRRPGGAGADPGDGGGERRQGDPRSAEDAGGAGDPRRAGDRLSARTRCPPSGRATRPAGAAAARRPRGDRPRRTGCAAARPAGRPARRQPDPAPRPRSRAASWRRISPRRWPSRRGGGRSPPRR